MSWNKSIVENTVNFTPEFWSDLFQEKEGLDSFWETDHVEQMEEDAFNPDHNEHIASWLYDESWRHLAIKHKLNGHIVFYDEPRHLGLTALIFKDGIITEPYVTILLSEEEIPDPPSEDSD